MKFRGSESNRKGAFQLSMGLVVVIIMSIVLLGLGIKWITSTVSVVSSLTYQVTDTAKDKLLKDLSSGNKKIGITAPGITRWRPGESGSFALGIRNDDTIDSRVFYINVNLIDAPFSDNNKLNELNQENNGKLYFTMHDMMKIEPLASDARTIVVDFKSKSLNDIPEGVYRFGVTVCRKDDTGVDVPRDCPTYLELESDQRNWDLIYDATTFNIQIDPNA